MTANTILKWFGRFAAGDFSLKSRNAKKRENVELSIDHILKPNKDILFEVYDKRLWNGFETIDGRLGFIFDKNYAPEMKLSVFDMMRGDVA